MENITELLSKISLPAVIYVINFIFIFAVLFLERKTSSARLAWIMVLAFMPIVGFVFYLVFNQNLSRIHINHLYDDEWNAVQTLLKNQMKQIGSCLYCRRNMKGRVRLVRSFWLI